ncbi:MAG: hypothetical protein U1F34_06055 [Gammaproteobacteria bacterium]
MAICTGVPVVLPSHTLCASCGGPGGSLRESAPLCVADALVIVKAGDSVTAINQDLIRMDVSGTKNMYVQERGGGKQPA